MTDDPQPPFVDPPTRVDIAGLRAVEARFEPTVEGFEEVARYLTRMADEISEPVSTGPSIGETGVLVKVASLDQSGLLLAAAESVRGAAVQVDQTLAKVVEVRERYEQTEQVNTDRAREIFGPDRGPGEVPADTSQPSRHPISGQVEVPPVPDPRGDLVDPGETGRSTLPEVAASLVNLPELGGVLGAVAALQLTPPEIALKVSAWAAGEWSSGVAQRTHQQAAAALMTLREGVERLFDYVSLVWDSPAAEVAAQHFAATLVAIDRVVEELANCSAGEANTLGILRDYDHLAADRIATMVQRWQELVALPSEQGAATSAPPGVGLVVSAGEQIALVAKVLSFNNAYLEFAELSEHTYNHLKAYRQEILLWARGAGLCPPATGAVPAPVPRY